VLHWPRGVGPRTRVVSETVTGDRCVVVVSDGSTTLELICIKIRGQWYLTDR
jgi:hypothetical protein